MQLSLVEFTADSAVHKVSSPIGTIWLGFSLYAPVFTTSLRWILWWTWQYGSLNGPRQVVDNASPMRYGDCTLSMRLYGWLTLYHRDLQDNNVSDLDRQRTHRLIENINVVPSVDAQTTLNEWVRESISFINAARLFLYVPHKRRRVSDKTLDFSKSTVYTVFLRFPDCCNCSFFDQDVVATPTHTSLSLVDTNIIPS